MNAWGAGSAALIAFAITAVLGKWFIPLLQKLKYGQVIRLEGPNWHKKKQGIPTMGGLMFIIGITAAIVLTVGALNLFGAVEIRETAAMQTRLWLGLLMALGFGLVGFIDDYISVVKKRNLGLNARQKLFMQILIASCYATTLYVTDSGITTIPFLGDLDLKIFFIPIAVFIIVGFVNAVNLTDGLDGLASSVTFIVALFFITAATFLSYFGMSIMAAATAGGCLGFLMWNYYPAKIFMGDTGSLFLGGLVCALSFGIGMPILILLVGIIYLFEALSVMLQVGYFKLTKGKRLFKMSPIHHHYEMKGFSEAQIVFLFSFITLLACAGAFAMLLYS